MRQRLLPLLFFLSGAAGLVQEVVWARRLGLTFGATVYAAGSVLAVYMAGLALGSLLAGRLAQHASRPRVWLAAAFAGAGASGALVLPLIDLLEGSYLAGSARLAWEGPAAAGARLLLALAALLIPCLLQGATFPLMARALSPQVPEAGRNAGLLYAWNTAGAAAGALLAGFFLLPRWGLLATSAIAAAAWLALAPLAALSRGRESPRKAPPGEPLAAARLPGLPGDIRGTLVAAAILCGFTALAYEVVWTRILQVFLRNSPYTFAVILASFLGGMALGSLLAARTRGAGRRSLRLFGLLQALLALAAMLLQPLFGRLPLLLGPLAAAAGRPLLLLFLPGLLLGFTLAFLPAILMGFAFPLLCRAWTESAGEGTALGLGRIYGLNTLGAVGGSLAAAFLLIPLAGTGGSNLLLALVNLALAAAAWRALRRAAIPAIAPLRGTARGTPVAAAGKRSKDRPAGRPAVVLPGRPAWAGLGLLLLLDLSLFALGVGSPARAILPPSVGRTAGREDRVLFYRETAPGTVVVVEDRKSGLRSCFVNNSVVCGTSYDALKVIRLLGHLPPMLRGTSAPARGLVIGFGTGVTSAALLRYPWLERLDCVEICPALREAAFFFHTVNRGVEAEPRLRLIPGDGRSWVAAGGERYDLISCDPTHPALGCGSLYSREYFTRCREILRPGGVLCQYLPLHKMSERDLTTALATFREVFPRSLLWIGFSHGILAGYADDRAPVVEVDFLARCFTLPGVAEDLYPCHLETPYDLLASFALGEEGMEALAAGEGRRNTDDRPVLEYSGSAALHPDAWSRNMELLLARLESPLDLLHGPGPSGPPAPLFRETLARYLEGKKRLYEGQVAWRRGRLGEALRLFEQGFRTNPEDYELSDMADLARAGLGRAIPDPFAAGDGSDPYGGWAPRR